MLGLDLSSVPIWSLEGFLSLVGDFTSLAEWIR